MRLLVCFVFCFSLLLCGCSSESVKTDPKSVTPPPTSRNDAKQHHDIRVD